MTSQASLPHTPHRPSGAVGRRSIGSSTFLSSPITPTNRPNLSSFSSPGSLHQVEEPLIFEIGTRIFRAGYANEANPRCIIPIRPELFGRIGLKGRGGTRNNLRTGEKAGSRVRIDASSDWELWSNDLKTTDIGYIEDALERLLREAYNKYLLVDSKSKRLLVTFSELLPTTLQTCLAKVVFSHFQPPSITFMSSSVVSTIAAGLRAALVMDIGWRETTVTPVYELRTISTGIRCSTRASKALVMRVGEMLYRSTPEYLETVEWWQVLDFEEVEDVVTRVLWCKRSKEAKEERRVRFRRALGIADDPADSDSDNDEDDDDEFHDAEHEPTQELPSAIDHAIFDIPFKTPTLSQPITTISIPFKNLCAAVEATFFLPSFTPVTAIDCPEAIPIPTREDVLMHHIDDPDSEDDSTHTLPFLIYLSLLQTDIDIRAASLPRIIITGGASNIPGLKSRIISDLKDIVERRGWKQVRPRKLQGAAKEKALADKEDENSVTELLESEKENMRIKHAATGGVPPGTVRGVETLGAWCGGSIIAGAKIKGVQELEREKFLTNLANGGTGLG